MLGKQLKWDVGIGAFFVLALAVFFFLTALIGHSHRESNGAGYDLEAKFEDTSGLTVGSLVRLSGVVIGEVQAIQVIPTTFNARVNLRIYDSRLQLPLDSTAGIYTEGLLGAKYVALSPGYDETNLKPGEEIIHTKSAVVLENLLGKVLLLMGDKS